MAADTTGPTVAVRRQGETRRILNCVPSRGQEDDWGVGVAESAGLLARTARVPDSVDLRASWWRVGDQGATGSCVGWATADSVLRWHFTQAERLRQNEQLSVRYVWMASKESDEFRQRPSTFIELEGTSLKAALDVARKYGCVRRRDLPFEPPDLYAGDVRTFYLHASQRKIAAYVNLGRTPQNWRRWLATHGPVLVRLDCDDTWMEASSTRGRLDEYQADTAQGGHAVALVGYTPDHLVVRNSWGRSWGDKGFAYASDAYAGAAFTEAYGVSAL